MKSKELLIDALIHRGADRISHSGRSFLDHLLGTYDLLDSWGSAPSVCLAGLFHSVYGTEYFQCDLEPPFTRVEVVELIGIQAEKLVFLFSQVRRDSLEKVSDVTKAGRESYLLPLREPGTAARVKYETVRNLLEIHSANQKEQRLGIQPTNVKTRLARISFFKLPKGDISQIPEDMKVCLVGIPSDLGAHKPGSRNGPKELREASAAMARRSADGEGIMSIERMDFPLSGWKACDCGDVWMERMNIDQALIEVERVFRQIPKHCIPIGIGGDHTFTLGIIRSRVHKDEDFHLVHIDQHLDIQLWGRFNKEASLNLTPPIHSNFVSHLLEQFPKMKLTQIGVKSFANIPSVDQPQRTWFLEYVRGTGKKITDYQVQSLSMEEITKLLPSSENVYLSIDVDVLSWADVSETGYPSALGIKYSRLIELLNLLIGMNHIIGFDLMEFGSGEKVSYRGGGELCSNLLLRSISMLLN